MTSKLRRSMMACPAILALCIACATAVFAPPASADGDPIAGKLLYEAYCQQCHRGGLGDTARAAAADLCTLNHEPRAGTSLRVRALSCAELTDIAAYFVGPSTASKTYQGLWWVPGGAEAFWGINVAYRGEQVFATWYTYDTKGNPWWLSMLADRTSPTSTVFAGPIYVDNGPPFHAYAGKAVPARVGTGTLTFNAADEAMFAYAVDAGEGPVSQTKTLTRFVLDATSAQPTCTWNAMTPNFAATTNYQDLWWVAGGAEDGWGLNFAHQGALLFATWYTYGTNGAPLWLAVLAQRVGATNVYTGTLYRTSGPRYDAYDATKAISQQVGIATFTFADGNHAAFDYATNGAGGLPIAMQTKQITRFPAAAGGVVCR